MLFSCTKDLGNYNYKNINEVSIIGLKDFYRVEYPDGKLQVPIELKSTLDNGKQDRYMYEWKAVKSITGGAAYVLSNEKNLNYDVNILPGSYTLYFKVTDKETGIIWKSYTSLAVSTSTSRGFLLIGNNALGNAQLDMIKMPLDGDTTVAVNLMRNSNLPQLKGAVNVMFTGGMSNMNNSKFWIMTDDGSYYLDKTTFNANLYNKFRPLTFTMMPISDNIALVDVAPRVNKIGGTASTTSCRAVSTNDGNIFYNSSIISGDAYGNPINRIDPNVDLYFKASPYLMYSMGYFRGLVVYDNDNNRFTFCASTGTNVKTLSDKAGEIFPWNQEGNGRKLIYAENTRNTSNGAIYGNTFALMKDGSGIYHIYMINPSYTSTTPSKTGYYQINESLATNFAKAEQKKLYAFSSTRTLLLYAVGSSLYYYDYNKGNERSGLLRNFGGDEITMLKFDIQTGNNEYRDLYVATKNSTGLGTLRKLVMGTNVDVIDYTEEKNTAWTGLSAIVQMDWRSQE